MDQAQDQQVVHSEKQQDKSSEKRKRGHLENLTRSFPSTGLHAHRRQPSLNTPSLVPVDSEPLLPGEDGLQAKGSARSWSWGELLHLLTESVSGWERSSPYTKPTCISRTPNLKYISHRRNNLTKPVGIYDTSNKIYDEIGTQKAPLEPPGFN